MTNPKHILNINSLEYQGFPGGYPDHVKEKYEGTVMGQAGRMLGSKKLGFNVTKIPPGKRAFPMHNHHINEELAFVLKGCGELRLGAERHAISAGDFVFLPPGGPELAHQIINTSDAELVLLAFSSKETPEFVEYPDSKKFGFMSPSGFRHVGRMDEGLGYWDGE